MAPVYPLERDKADRSWGMLREDEALLEGLVAQLPEGSRVVNVGAGAGVSTLAILRGARDLRDFRVWSVDIDPVRSRVEMHQVERLSKLGIPVGNKYERIQGDSAEVAKGWQVPLNLCFIDGDHYRVPEDLAAWKAHILFGGYVALHDYIESIVSDAVQQAVLMFLAATSGKHAEWIVVGYLGRTLLLRREEAPDVCLA